MAFEKIAERKIRDAMADGSFDVVADGRRIDLDEYFSVSEELRAAYALMKSAGCVPAEVEYLKDVDRLRDALAAAADDGARRQLQQDLTQATLRLELALENARRK